MKRSDCTLLMILVSALTLLDAGTLSAQDIVVPDGYELVDSIVYRHVPAVDTLLAGQDVFQVMPAKAQIYQSEGVAGAVKKQTVANVRRPISGYRVRIFFDNRQTARKESEETLKKFESMYHDVKAYRTYANPYFKVTVGDFRTKSEAMELLSRINVNFPSSFVVKENIAYPVVDRENSFVIDTIKVLRPVAVKL